jgi:hypothetical protein
MTPPTVFATLSRDRRTVQIRCPYCGDAHLHGAAGILDGRNNHRLSHCLNKRFANAAGYFIELQPSATRAIREDALHA